MKLTDMYRPALVVKTFLNKRNECGHVFGIFSGLLPSAMMVFALSVLITPAAFSARVSTRVSESRFDRLPVMSWTFVAAGKIPSWTAGFLFYAITGRYSSFFASKFQIILAVLLARATAAICLPRRVATP